MSELLMRAAQAMRRGDFKDAIRHSREHLSQSPDDFNGHHLLGIALCEAGDLDAGRAEVDRAISLSPDNPDPHYNLAGVLMARQQLAEAELCYRRALELQPKHYSAWNNLGSLLNRSGRTEEAMAAYRQVLEIRQNHPGAHRNLANLLLEDGQLEAAESAFRKALEIEPENIATVRGLGGVLFALGRTAEAAELVDWALKRQPDHPVLLSILGGILLQGGSYEEAEKVLRKAVDQEPNLFEARDNLGVALGNLGRIEEARECYQAVLESHPEHVSARANLAKLLEMVHQTDAAREIAEQGLALQPDYAALHVVVARCDRRGGQAEAAAKRLEDLLERAADQKAPKEVHFELGTIYDRLGRYPQAYEQFLLGNQRAGEWWQHVDGAADTFLDGVEVLNEQFSKEWVDSWSEAAPVQDTPVFLLGFQRSGTTLFDTILDAHSGLQVMEEAPALLGLVDELARGQGYPNALADLNSNDVGVLQALYYRQVDKALSRDPACRLVDKMPLNTAHLGLIQRVFPGAPIILALRHPLDVCLSCFMQDFALNSFMTNYQSLEGVAKVYQQVMSLSVRYQELLPLNLISVRYEDVVADFDAQIKRLLDFLGLEWEDGLASFDSHAKSRGLINTPSYHQVSQPIYASARYRWRNYQQQLAPIEPLVRPFIDRFGYKES